MASSRISLILSFADFIVRSRYFFKFHNTIDSSKKKKKKKSISKIYQASNNFIISKINFIVRITTRSKIITTLLVVHAHERTNARRASRILSSFRGSLFHRGWAGYYNHVVLSIDVCTLPLSPSLSLPSCLSLSTYIRWLKRGSCRESVRRKGGSWQGEDAA